MRKINKYHHSIYNNKSRDKTYCDIPRTRTDKNIRYTRKYLPTGYVVGYYLKLDLRNVKLKCHN